MTQPISSRTELSYVGDELELFARAVNWKRYWSRSLRPYVAGHVIEVGAGIGASTAFACDGTQSSWLCLEPDPRLASQLAQRIRDGQLPPCCRVEIGILSDLPARQLADTILYIDVLEHVEDDGAELRTAAAHLRPGGRLIVLSPAFSLLYSPFDRAVGHYRRYTRHDVLRITPPDLHPERQYYLDSVGMLASLANRWLLRSTTPSQRSILLWDRVMVPVSRCVDHVFGSVGGRSILMVWRKKPT